MNRKNFFKNIGLLSALPLLNSVEAYAGANLLAKHEINVLTCNIRVALEEDDSKGFGWKDRREICLKVINTQNPDIIGFQEVLKSQFLDLKDGLKDFHGLNFDGPEMDMHKKGYHGVAKNPIFFSKKRFDLVAAGGYWLSETPLVAGSKSWNTARARNMSWVRLLDKVTGKEFRFITLHLDHVSNEAKLAQISLVLEESAQYQSDFPQILVGDFNAGPTSKIIGSVLSSGWKDAYVEANGNQSSGPTVHSFFGEKDPKKDLRKKIDFIFLKGPVTAHRSAVVKDALNGRYPSDHYFLKATVVLN